MILPITREPSPRCTNYLQFISNDRNLDEILNELVDVVRFAFNFTRCLLENYNNYENYSVLGVITASFEGSIRNARNAFDDLNEDTRKHLINAVYPFFINNHYVTVEEKSNVRELADFEFASSVPYYIGLYVYYTVRKTPVIDRVTSLSIIYTAIDSSLNGYEYILQNPVCHHQTNFSNDSVVDPVPSL